MTAVFIHATNNAHIAHKRRYVVLDAVHTMQAIDSDTLTCPYSYGLRGVGVWGVVSKVSTWERYLLSHWQHRALSKAAAVKIGPRTRHDESGTFRHRHHSE